MGRRLIRIYVTPLLASCSVVLPWYLFARFVLNLDLKVEVLSIGIIIVFYIAFLVMRRWEEGVGKEKRETVLVKYVALYGKAVTLWVSIQFLIAVMAILMLLVLR